MGDDAMFEREAKRRGITVTELKMLEAVPDNVIRDIVADNRRGMSQSQSMITSRPEVEPTRRSNKEPRPLQPPPGIALVDRLGEAQDARDRAERRR